MVSDRKFYIFYISPAENRSVEIIDTSENYSITDCQRMTLPQWNMLTLTTHPFPAAASIAQYTSTGCR